MSYLNLFPVTGHYTYLNTAYSGILSTTAQEWRNKHDEQFLLEGSNHRLKHGVLFSELRQNLANLFGSDTGQVFLVPNFSFGFNTLLDGLDKKHRFLLLEEDYPSVNYPVRSRGFEQIAVPITADVEEHILAAIESFKPSVFAFSMVQYISGLRIAPDFIRTIKQTYPDLLLIADGTQFCGTVPFDFKNSGLDAIISSGYKWMMAGFGNGFAFLSEQLKAQLFLERKKVALPTENFLQDKDHLSLCFEPGHMDSLNFGTLNQSLYQLQSVGLENIERTTQSICLKARTEFYYRGLLSTEITERKVQSTIISIPLPPTVCEKLTEAKILFSNRGTGSRFSFHFYNAHDDLNRLLAILDAHS